MQFTLGPKTVQAISDGGLSLYPDPRCSTSYPILCIEVIIYLCPISHYPSSACIFPSYVYHIRFPFWVLSSAVSWFFVLTWDRPNDKNMLNVTVSQRNTHTPLKSMLKCSEWSVIRSSTIDHLVDPIIKRYSFYPWFCALCLVVSFLVSSFVSRLIFVFIK